MFQKKVNLFNCSVALALIILVSRDEGAHLFHVRVGIHGDVGAVSLDVALRVVLGEITCHVRCLAHGFRSAVLVLANGAVVGDAVLVGESAASGFTVVAVPAGAWLVFVLRLASLAFELADGAVAVVLGLTGGVAILGW